MIRPGPARMGRTETASAAIEDLGVRSLALPADAPVRLAELRANTGLKLPDCCVLLAAESASEATAVRVGTFDDQLIATARSQGVDVA